MTGTLLRNVVRICFCRLTEPIYNDGVHVKRAGLIDLKTLLPRNLNNMTYAVRCPLQDGPVQGSKYQTQEVNSSNLSFEQKVMFALVGPVMKLMFGTQDYAETEITVLEPNQRVTWKARLPSTRKGG